MVRMLTRIRSRPWRQREATRPRSDRMGTPRIRRGLRISRRKAIRNPRYIRSLTPPTVRAKARKATAPVRATAPTGQGSRSLRRSSVRRAATERK
jgi:hypothetical protein